MSRLAYRPEIDGLRALAVLAVVFFHTNLKFAGGFVGVDVFFVISGFLITSLIRKDIAAGTFSLSAFWERRIRRIMPAATVAVLASLLVGYFVLLPSDFANLGRSAIAQALIAANVFFYLDAGYFSAAAESKPLLHFWSLAVEEQFYVLFPLLLVALRRSREHVVVWAVGGMAVASFALSVFGVYRFPDATFYLLPTRAWELALGALLALRGSRLPIPERARTAAGWIGLFLILAPMVVYDRQTVFPGLAALPPCAGAVLVIWSTAAGTSLLRRMLSLGLVVKVGVLSYSLYLWHWPVMVYTHYWFLEALSPLAMRMVVVLSSLGLAWLSWRYVEVPFRAGRSGMKMKPLLYGAAAVTALTLAIGALVVRQDGFPERFPEAIAQFDAAYGDRVEAGEADLTTEAAEAGNITALVEHPSASGSVLIWGDSHARVASPGLAGICRNLGVNAYRASRSETPSLMTWGSPDVRRYNSAVLRWIERRRPTWVVLASRWEKGLKTSEDEEALRATVRAIQAYGVNVSIMRQVATQRRDVPKALARATLTGGVTGDVGIPVAEHAIFTRRSNRIIDRVGRSTSGLRVLDPIPYLSRDGRCIAEDAGRPLYYDYQHLTRFGASFLEPMFASLIESPRETSTERSAPGREGTAPSFAEVAPGPRPR